MANAWGSSLDAAVVPGRWAADFGTAELELDEVVRRTAELGCLVVAFGTGEAGWNVIGLVGYGMTGVASAGYTADAGCFGSNYVAESEGSGRGKASGWGRGRAGQMMGKGESREGELPGKYYCH